MGAVFDDSPFIQHQHPVGVLDGRQAVRDHDGGAVYREALQGFLDQRLRFGVQGGGGLVQQQDGGIFQDGSCQGNALALPARQASAPFSGQGVVTFGQGHDEVVDVGQPGSPLDLLLAGARPAEADILGQADREKVGVLGHEGHLLRGQRTAASRSGRLRTG